MAGYEKYAVRWLTWFDAAAFCDWRTESEGLPPGSYHLPIEAQWEKAAGWTPGNTRLWTYAIQSDVIDCGRANYNNCVGGVTEVGRYRCYKSHYGCFDMSGNAWEWCSDFWGDYPSGQFDPSGPESGVDRSLRGGSWFEAGPGVEVGHRHHADPNSTSSGYGFRCARTVCPR